MVRYEVNRRYSEIGDEEQEAYIKRVEKERMKRCLCRCCKITAITILVFILVLLFLIYVVLPIVFLCSIEFQRFIMFPNILEPINPEYDNFEKYNVQGVRNFYVPVVDIDTNQTIYLGVWHLLPESLVNDSIKDPNYDFASQLAHSFHPVVIYFHGNSGTRIAPLDTYLVLREFFHVIAFDYRNYGDSTPAVLSEPAVVNDAVQLYKWVQEHTIADIYVWGHSLGTALSTHTVKMLKKEDIVPMGLVLESPFTTMREEITVHPIGKVFSWLPYFTATVLDPLEKNGFHFKTTTNILDVYCPIMIMNAEDDSIIPYELGYRLYEVARTERDIVTQGNVTYHQFEGHLGYNHLGLTRDDRVPKYISEFIHDCEKFWNK